MGYYSDRIKVTRFFKKRCHRKIGWYRDDRTGLRFIDPLPDGIK